jgi:hypothetical protein
MTVAIAIGKHNLSVAPVIIAVIIIGVAIYFIWKRRSGRPNGGDKKTGKFAVAPGREAGVGEVLEEKAREHVRHLAAAPPVIDDRDHGPVVRGADRADLNCHPQGSSRSAVRCTRHGRCPHGETATGREQMLCYRPVVVNLRAG